MRISLRWKFYRFTNTNVDGPRLGKLLAGLLHFKQAVNPHGQNWNAEIRRQQADAGAKRTDLPIRCMTPLRKNKHAVPAIDRFTCVREAAAEASLARQRK